MTPMVLGSGNAVTYRDLVMVIATFVITITKSIGRKVQLLPAVGPLYSTIW